MDARCVKRRVWQLAGVCGRLDFHLRCVGLLNFAQVCGNALPIRSAGHQARALLRAAPAVGVTPSALAASAALLACAAHSASAQEWHAGAGLSAGDSFTYSVCEKDCYEVSLDFVAELASDGRSAWVVQARVSGGGQHILLLDSATMDLRPAAYDFGLSGSLSRTLLYISEFAPPHRPKGLEPGTAWGHVPGSPVQGTQLAVMSRDTVEAGGARHEAALLQYTIFETSTVAVSPDFPFPVSAVVYGPFQTVPDPPVAFAFQLQGYSRAEPCPTRGDVSPSRDASVPTRGDVGADPGAP